MDKTGLIRMLKALCRRRMSSVPNRCSFFLSILKGGKRDREGEGESERERKRKKMDGKMMENGKKERPMSFEVLVDVPAGGREVGNPFLCFVPAARSSQQQQQQQVTAAP